tara:strand:+ start:1847 stop:2296 length:450 start_codon:yes stop_codon:yes gene_type:complete
MKDYDGKRIPLRMRWEAFTQDMREEIAIHGVRHLGVEWFSHYWYKGVTSPWLRSPLGSFIRKSRGYDEVVRHCQGYVCDIRELRNHLRAHEAQDNAEIWNLRTEVRQLRENRDLLREALQIGFAERQDKLELLLVDAEVNIRMRESEPF